MKRFAAAGIVLLLIAAATLSMGADQYRINKAIRFHGEFSSADPSALSEANSRITLYGDGSTTAITLAATDQVIITDINTGSGASNVITVYDGADATVDAGEKILYMRQTTVGAAMSLLTPRFCQVGTYPKVKGSAVQTDVVVHGYIYRGD